MKNTISRQSLATTLAVCLWLLTAATAFAQGPAFTHQGRLTDNGAAASGGYDLQFALFDAMTGGAQQGATLTRDDVPVTNGVFTVQLDFGSAPFDTGAPRFLQIGVRAGTSTGVFTTLTPRQPLSATPYAIRSQSAATAALADGLSANCVGCITATQIQGGGNFIQNGTTPQANANFNISGSGTAGGALSANTVSAVGITASFFVDAPQYNLSGGRILSNAGFGNLFVGFDAGVGTTGQNNTFVGARAGRVTTSGLDNSFYGASAGAANVTSERNSFFGSQAGSLNTVSGNSFFGFQAGAGNITGTQNASFGLQAGLLNSTGSENSFFGSRSGFFSTGSSNAFFGANAGRANQGGSFNTFIGRQAGMNVTSGSGNVFIGNDTGAGNMTGSSNTALGSGANVGDGLTFATAIGAGASVSTGNTVVLGRGADVVTIPGRLSIFSFGTAGGTSACINASNQLSFCSSSLRYKTDISPYRHGLDFIKRLQPISFTWKDGGMRDLGFGAEEVAKIDPRLVVYDKDGQVEGVKYDRLSALLVNAVREQQAQIEAQQRQIAELRTQLAALAAQLTQQKPVAQR